MTPNLLEKLKNLDQVPNVKEKREMIMRDWKQKKKAKKTNGKMTGSYKPKK